MTLEEKKNYIESIALNMLNENNINSYQIEFNKSKRSAGICYWGRKTVIKFSEIYIAHYTKDELFELAAHEVAHALTPGEHHNWKWKKECLRLGGNGKRTFKTESMNNADSLNDTLREKSKYILKCPVCKNTVYFNRKLKYERSCGKCYPGFNKQFKMEVIQNY